MPHPKMKKVKGWAVWNSKLNTPCVEINKEGDIIGTAIFSDPDGYNKRDAIEWVKTRFPNDFKSIKRDLGLKIIPIIISLPSRSKQ